MKKQSNLRELPVISQIWAARTDLVLVFGFIFIVFLYALLMILDQIPPLALGVLVGLWFLYWLLSGRLTYLTPFDLPILGLLCLLPLSLSISVDLGMSLAKVYGLLLGFALFYVIVCFFNQQRRLLIAIFGLIILANSIALIGLLILGWPNEMFSFITNLAETLFRSQESILGLGSISETNPNTIGGVLAFFSPLLAGLLWDRGGFKRMFLSLSTHPQRINTFYKLTLLISLLLNLAILILTQSRGGWLGAVCGLLALAVWKDRRFLWTLPILFAGFLITFHIFARGNLEVLIINLDNRIISWRAAIYLIQDYPFSGGGIGTFGRLSSAFYTFTSLSSQGTTYFHAHNNLLAAGVDLGIPGMVFYSALLGNVATMAQRTNYTGRTFIQAFTAGLTCGVLAHQVFGLTDAFMLGAKLGVVMWIFFGLIAALFVHRRKINNGTKQGNSGEKPFQPPCWQHAKGRISDLLLGLALWAGISLSAVTFVTNNPYLAIAISIVGGFLLGVVLTKRFRETSYKLKIINP